MIISEQQFKSSLWEIIHTILKAAKKIHNISGSKLALDYSDLVWFGVCTFQNIAKIIGFNTKQCGGI